MALARLDLVRRGVPVPGRAAFQDVRYVHVRAGEADAAQERVEQLPRLADEGLALFVLVEPRRLADEHQIGVRVANAEHDLRSRLGEPALRTARDLGAERPQRESPTRRVMHRPAV